MSVTIDGALTFKEHLKQLKEKTDKRVKSIVYLNQKEISPDLIIKAFQSYTYHINLNISRIFYSTRQKKIFQFIGRVNA